MERAVQAKVEKSTMRGEPMDRRNEGQDLERTRAEVEDRIDHYVDTMSHQLADRVGEYMERELPQFAHRMAQELGGRAEHYAEMIAHRINEQSHRYARQLNSVTRDSVHRYARKAQRYGEEVPRRMRRYGRRAQARAGQVAQNRTSLAIIGLGVVGIVAGVMMAQRMRD